MKIIASLAFVIMGLILVLKPEPFAAKLQRFYLAYPIIHYAGAKQLKSRPFWIVLFGITIIIVGCVGLFS
jgi:hypothetical protein